MFAQYPPDSVTVELHMEKKVYRLGEPIAFRVLLINTGRKEIYLRKEFDWSVCGNGSSGFVAEVRQLSGNRPEKIGHCAGDTFRFDDQRDASQILAEDFVRLSPGAMVGFQSDTYSPSGIAHPGTYELIVHYGAYYIPKSVIALNPEGERVLQGTFSSAPIPFVVRTRRRK